jgi:hypothetical protein
VSLPLFRHFFLTHDPGFLVPESPDVKSREGTEPILGTYFATINTFFQLKSVNRGHELGP